MANWRKSGAGENVDSGPGSKSGKKSSGSVGDLNQSSSVTHNEKTHDVEFAKGGTTPMFGEQAAGDQKAATTAHDVGGGAPGAKFAEGGKGKMFGFSGALPARDGITSAR